MKQQFGFAKSETTEYIGRAVVALAGDAGVAKKSGQIHFVADLAKEYGFTDVDGRQIPRFMPRNARGLRDSETPQAREVSSKAYPQPRG